MTVFPLAAAQPAAAHDVAEAVEPADGAVVTAVPGMVRLTFNRTPIAIGSQILVKDESGTNQAVGPVVIVNNHVAQAIKAGAPAGRYKVLWRVVSSDSHPIEGSFTFTAGQANGIRKSGTAQPATPAPVHEPAEAAGFPWGVAAGGTALAAGLLATGAYVRRRLAPNDAATSTENESCYETREPGRQHVMIARRRRCGTGGTVELNGRQNWATARLVPVPESCQLPNRATAPRSRR